MLLVILIQPLEGGTVWPLFLAFSVLFTVLPVAYVGVTWLIVPTALLISCLAVYVSIQPLPFQSITVRFSQYSEAVGQVPGPLAFVYRATWPCLFALAVFGVIQPLAFVDGAGLWADPSGPIFSYLRLLSRASFWPF